MEQPPGYRSFLVRLWLEADVEGHDRWCGEVEQIQSGYRRPFTSFNDLVALLRPDPSPNLWEVPDGAREGAA